jgi:flagellar basal-body rod protein FlgB
MEPIFGVHETALLFRARRMDVLSANLANADTPNFKARDMEFTGRDFDAALRDAAAASTVRRTHARHLSAAGASADQAPLFRNPHQPSLDGNTVETDLELARFAENSVAYQASLLFLNGRIASLRAAITGGR